MIFIQACEDGDLELVKQLLTEVTGDELERGLLFAELYQHEEIVNFLLSISSPDISSKHKERVETVRREWPNF